MFPSDEIARFWSRVEKSDGCWTWTGGTNNPRYDYGRMMIERKRYSPHRVSWIIAFGPIPAEQRVCHSCDNPRCVRPDHLFLGTILQNNRDRDSKGRHARLRGEMNPFSKLREQEVAEIRRLYQPRECSQRFLANKFGVSQGTIWQIVNGNRWEHVTTQAHLE